MNVSVIGGGGWGDRKTGARVYFEGMKAGRRERWLQERSKGADGGGSYALSLVGH